MKMKNYTIIPNEVLERSELSIIERYLFCVLLKFCGKDDFCFPSQQTLSQILGISDRHIRTLLARLEELGLIHKIHHGWNRSNTYFVSKSLSIDRNCSSYPIRSMFPLQQGTALPTKNTYLKGKGKRSLKGLESTRDILIRKGLIKEIR